ncbi:MAG: hypothetical protein WB245_09200, partial [Acidimicrobiia bacterium]
MRLQLHLERSAGQGRVWWCELPELSRRPIVLLARDAAIPRLRPVVIAPCTT